MDTQNEPLDALPNDNDLMAAAMAVPDDDTPPDEGGSKDGEGAAATTTPAPKDGEAAADSRGEPDPFDLASLRQIAAERRAQREPAKPEPAAPAPDLAKLADHMSGAAEYRAAVEAFAQGDASKLAKLAGKDEATLYEGWTQRVMKGDAAGTEAKVAELQAELAALKGAKPEGVMTEARYEQIQQEKARANAVETFRNTVSDAEKYPVLGKIASDRALEYGDRAADLLRAANKPLDLPSIGAVAERLARDELGGLSAQQETGRTVTDGGHSEAAATSATTSSRRGGEIDNRAAAEAASTLPDFTDESAYIERAMRAAEAE